MAETHIRERTIWRLSKCVSHERWALLFCFVLEISRPLTLTSHVHLGESVGDKHRETFGPGVCPSPTEITAGMGTDDTVSRHGLLTWITIWANGMLWSFRSCFVDLSNWPRTSVAVAPEKSGGGSRLRLSRDSVCCGVGWEH